MRRNGSGLIQEALRWRWLPESSRSVIFPGSHRGGRAINDLLAQPDATEGWWPESVRQLLGSRSLANRNGADHRTRRRVVGQLFSAAALRRYSPAIVELVNELAAELQSSEGPVPLVERMRRFAFAVIATVVLGLEGECAWARP